MFALVTAGNLALSGPKALGPSPIRTASDLGQYA